MVKSQDVMSATSTPPNRSVESSAAIGAPVGSVGLVRIAVPVVLTDIAPVLTQLGSNEMMPFGAIEILTDFQKQSGNTRLAPRSACHSSTVKYRFTRALATGLMTFRPRRMIEQVVSATALAVRVSATVIVV